MASGRLRTAVGALAVGLALFATGCSDLRMTVVDSQERVLSRRTRTVVSNVVNVDRQIDVTRLMIITTRGCNLVRSEEVERIETLESDEDPTEEWTLLGLLTAPITSGAILIIDGQYVYDNDRNSRLYNPTGPTGAYVGGGVLLGVGVLLAAVPFVELVRIAEASEERISTFQRENVTLQRDVPCDGAPTPVRAAVSLRVGSTHINRQTDPNGQLFIDLAEAIRPSIAQQHENLELHVANRLIDVIPMSVVRDEQQRRRERREQDAWTSADPEACIAAAPGNKSACDGVRRYLQQFPSGHHAGEAREILDARRPLTIATDEAAAKQPPPKAAGSDAVLARAKRRAQKACTITCTNSCVSKGTSKAVKACAKACVQEVCQ